MPSPKKVRIRHAVTIDVLIPAIEKDLATLPYVIDAVRTHVKHPIGRILIVAPKKTRILDFCRKRAVPLSMRIQSSRLQKRYPLPFTEMGKIRLVVPAIVETEW